jgi:site-specific DNA-adenine methylase
MGSKAKYADHIVPILQKAIDDNNVDTYIECFVGGANIIDKIKCNCRFGYDRSETLIALLDLSSKDFTAVPTEGSRELWDKGKGYVKDGIMPEDMTLAEIGAIEFFASFSNRGFPGGYAKNTTTRNYYKEAYRNLKEQAPNLHGITFKAQNYWELDENTKNCVIYLDPPYQGTKEYGYANQAKMDYDHFWNWVRDISKDNYVFVSEQNAPDDFDILWVQEAKRTVGADNNYKAVEKLFKYKEGK